jgi:hypothetical protein
VPRLAEVELRAMKRANSSENRNFYWHCQSAALLIETLPQNPATLANIRQAIRLATCNAIGKRGISLATQGAHNLKRSSDKDWYKLGLIREHVYPVNLVCEKALAEALNKTPVRWDELLGTLTNSDLSYWNYEGQSGMAPLSAKIAKIVRENTVIAWATREDDAELKRKGLNKKMPADYREGDLHARYHACGLDLIPID